MIRQGLLVFSRQASVADVRRRFGGLTMLDRGVRTLARSGATHVVVLLPAGIPARVRRLPPKCRASVDVVRWEDNRSLPLEAGAGVAVLIGDHAHHHTSLSALVETYGEADELVIHARRRGGPDDEFGSRPGGIGVDDTGVLRFGDAGALEITGAFLCGPTIGMAELSGSTLDLLPFLESRAEAGSGVELRDDRTGLWCRVTDPRSARRAKRMLFAQVTKKTSGPVSRHLNARISIPISKALIETGISPHLVTVFFVMSTGLFSAYLTSDPTSYPRLALAGFLWHMAAVLDRCDGEIARVKLSESQFGAWFDTVTDNLAYFCMYGAIIVGTRRVHPDQPVYMYLAASAIVALVLSMVLLYSYAIKTGSGSLQNYLVGFREHVPEREKGWMYRALERYAFLTKRDSFSFMFLLAAVANLFDVIYWVLVGGLHLIAVGVVLSQRKMLASYPDPPVAAAPPAGVPTPDSEAP